MTRDDATPAEDDDEPSRRRKAVDGFDSGIVDLLSWVLDTETRAKIYIFLQANPASTSEEIAQGTGLYPSTVREALAELHDEEKVDREKRESKGAGNNPYEYTAIPPSDLVSGVVGQVQDELNTVFNLDDTLAGDDEADATDASTDQDEPVTITVESDDSDDLTSGQGGGESDTEPPADADGASDDGGDDADDADDPTTQSEE